MAGATYLLGCFLLLSSFTLSGEHHATLLLLAALRSNTQSRRNAKETQSLRGRMVSYLITHYHHPSHTARQGSCRLQVPYDADLLAPPQQPMPCTQTPSTTIRSSLHRLRNRHRLFLHCDPEMAHVPREFLDAMALPFQTSPRWRQPTQLPRDPPR